MGKLILSLLLFFSNGVFAHGWNDPHQSYRVQDGVKTIYIQMEINNYRKDVSDFYITVLEDDEQIDFASQQRTYNLIYGSRPLTVGVYIKNDKPLPRKLLLCSNSYGDNLDDNGKKKAVNIRSRVCGLILIRPM
jgi:hypothetical protein